MTSKTTQRNFEVHSSRRTEAGERDLLVGSHQIPAIGVFRHGTLYCYQSSRVIVLGPGRLTMRSTKIRSGFAQVRAEFANFIEIHNQATASHDEFRNEAITRITAVNNELAQLRTEIMAREQAWRYNEWVIMEPRVDPARARRQCYMCRQEPELCYHPDV